MGSQKHQTSGSRNKQFIIVSIISRSGTCHTVILYFVTTSFTVSIHQPNKVENAVSYTMSLLISKNVLVTYNLATSYHVRLALCCASLTSCTPTTLALLCTILWLDPASVLAGYFFPLLAPALTSLEQSLSWYYFHPHYFQHKIHLRIQDYSQSILLNIVSTLLLHRIGFCGHTDIITVFSSKIVSQ